MARVGEGIVRRIDRWFPDRQLLIRGPNKISAVTISKRQQIYMAAVATISVTWLGAASLGIALAFCSQSKAAQSARRLEMTEAGDQVTINKITAECARLAAERNIAVVQATQMRDAAVARADFIRDQAVAQADHLRDQAISQARLTAAADSEITSQLTKQTQATIGQVETIIKSTGLDPDRLAQLPAAKAGVAARFKPAAQPGLTADDLTQAELLSHDISRLQSLGKILGQMPLIPPVAEVSISSPFGYRPDPWTGVREFHVGIDIRGAIGSPVYSTAPGVVTFAGVSTGYGNLIVIDHGYGLTTRYSHLEKILVSVGTSVAEHQEIGLLGNTGWSTGPHLLYETRVDGQPQNPLNFLKATP